jgi:hypothetical protein
MDLEAQAEYDQEPTHDKSRGESFDLGDNSLGTSNDGERKVSLDSPGLQAKKKRKARMSMARKRGDEGKVLTFVDMSALSYLSKSVSTGNQFLKH